MVTEFMAYAGQDLPTSPNLPDKDVRVLRIKLIAEELAELAAASNVEVVLNIDGVHYRSNVQKYLGEHDPRIVDAADAIADLLYVVYGAAIAWGIRIDPVFGEVHSSNMSKFIDGHRREDGKWQKGPSYKPARIKEVLDAQRQNG